MVRQALAANQADLGDMVTFIQSAANPNSQQCLIIAHGGLLATTRPTQFWTSVNLHFSVPHDTSHDLHAYAQIQVNQFADRDRDESEEAGLYFPAGTLCFNYSLKKYLGGHGSDYNYVQYQGHMGNGAWAPHVVSIRNRRTLGSTKTVLLSEVVDLVLDHQPTIKDMYCTNCRNAVGYVRTLKAQLFAQ